MSVLSGRGYGPSFWHLYHLTKAISVVTARAEHRQRCGSSGLVQGGWVIWVQRKDCGKTAHGGQTLQAPRGQPLPRRCGWTPKA